MRLPQRVSLKWNHGRALGGQERRWAAALAFATAVSLAAVAAVILYAALR